MTVTLPEFGALECLDERNKQASDVISAIARKHGVIDAATGAGSTLIPLVGPPAALAVQLTYQIKWVWPDMINRLAFIYGAEPDAVLKRRSDLLALGETFAQAAINEGIALAVQELSAELGTEFALEIATELLGEFGVGLLAGLVPLIGMGVAAFTDAAIAIAMTWSVGAMAALYFQHGGFVGNRKDTYHLIRQQLVPYVKTPARNSMKGMRTRAQVKIAVTDWVHDNTDRPDIMDRIRTLPEVRAGMVAKVRESARQLRIGIPDRTQVRRLLVTKGNEGAGLPEDIVDEAMAGL
jgi:uncharacterized protein (DUF697 family)